MRTDVMKRIVALFLLTAAVAACSPMAEQPQIAVTPRPTMTATNAPTADATTEATATPEADVTSEATDVAATEVTVEATEATEAATAEATEAAAADAVRVVDASPAAAIALGEDLFLHGRGDAVPCAGCHSHESDARLVGPGLLTVAERAATRNPDLTAAEYLHQSIVDPGALVVAGYFNMMPKDFGSLYSATEIDALVAYLMSLSAPVPQAVADASAGQ
jgi:cytochrome c2